MKAGTGILLLAIAVAAFWWFTKGSRALAQAQSAASGPSVATGLNEILGAGNYIADLGTAPPSGTIPLEPPLDPFANGNLPSFSPVLTNG